MRPKGGAAVLVVRGPRQQDGKGFRAGGAVHVSVERHAIARLHRDVVLHNHVGRSLVES